MPIGKHSTFIPSMSSRTSIYSGLAQRTPPKTAFLPGAQEGIYDTQGGINWFNLASTLGVYGIVGTAGVYLALAKAPTKEKRLMYGAIGGVSGVLLVSTLRVVVKFLKTRE